jgi:hypothetical protein
MASTSSRHADFINHANRAALHIRDNGAWAARVERRPDAQAPAGGVSSTVRDLVQWLRLELGNGSHDGKQLIAAAALDQTHVPLMARGSNPVSGGQSFYGLGWNIEFGRHGLSWGHAGAFSVGARSLVTLFPKQQLGIVILANAFPTGVPEGLSDSFADLVFDGKVAKDWVKDWDAIYAGLFGPAVAAAKATYATPPSPATPALSGEAYAGRYTNDFVGDAVVAATADGLVLKVGPDGAKSYPLRHFDRDLFLSLPYAELPDMPAAISFAIGPGGKASAVTIESLDGNGLGTLRRVGRLNLPASRSLDVALGLDDPPVAHAHQIDPAHRACVVSTPHQPPPDLAAVATGDDAFRFEMRALHRCNPAPQRDAGSLAFMARAVGRRLRVFNDAIVGNEIVQCRGIVAQEHLVEPLEDRFGLEAFGVGKTSACHNGLHFLGQAARRGAKKIPFELG